MKERAKRKSRRVSTPGRCLLSSLVSLFAARLQPGPLPECNPAYSRSSSHCETHLRERQRALSSARPRRSRARRVCLLRLPFSSQDCSFELESVETQNFSTYSANSSHLQGMAMSPLIGNGFLQLEMPFARFTSNHDPCFAQTHLYDLQRPPETPPAPKSATRGSG